MLAHKFTEDTPRTQVGSFGYRRGTAQRCRILQRNEPEPGQAERTCLVQLFQKIGGNWFPVRGSSGNTTVEERDLFATEEAATFPDPKTRRGQWRARS